MTEKFDPIRHLEMVYSWAKAWDMPIYPDLLPKTGRIVPGKAVIFLYKTDSSVGYVENLICNKEVDKQSASEAINACVTEIEKDAKEMGIKVLISSTTLKAVVQRAMSLGYQPKAQIMLYKELK